MIGLLEAATGIGLGVGPVIGSALYSFFGFWNTFLSAGVERSETEAIITDREVKKIVAEYEQISLY